MDPFEFILMPLALIVGMAITKLIEFLSQVIKYRKLFDHSLVYYIWLGLIFTFIFNFWFTFIREGKHLCPGFSFVDYVLLLFIPVLFYLAVEIYLPSSLSDKINEAKKEGSKKISLQAQHYSRGYSVFFIGIILLLRITVPELLREGLAIHSGIRLVAIILIFMMIFIKTERFQVYVSVLLGVLFILFIVLFSLKYEDIDFKKAPCIEELDNSSQEEVKTDEEVESLDQPSSPEP